MKGEVSPFGFNCDLNRDFRWGNKYVFLNSPQAAKRRRGKVGRDEGESGGQSVRSSQCATDSVSTPKG